MLHWAPSKTITFLRLEVELIRRTSLTQSNATISAKTYGRRSQDLPSIRRLGFLDTWVYHTKSLTMRLSFLEEKVPWLNRFSMDASYSMSKKWKSRKRVSLLIHAHSWTLLSCSVGTSTLSETTFIFTNITFQSRNELASQKRSLEPASEVTEFTHYMVHKTFL